MPELPEVETVRRELAPWLAGRTIVGAERVDAPPGPKYADLPRAVGQRIVAVARRGKFLILSLSGGDELVIHLGMTGVLSPDPSAAHVRVLITLSGRGRRRLYFSDPRRFGRCLVVRAGNYAALPILGRLGPEPLDGSFTAAALRAALAASAAPVKALLLGQRAVAGVGNIYADEALWRARIHPTTPAKRIGPRAARALHRAVVAVLEAAIAARGTTLRDFRTVGGDTGGFLAALAVYGREGEPCRRCGVTIVKIVVAQRGTHLCPRCQRARAR